MQVGQVSRIAFLHLGAFLFGFLASVLTVNTREVVPAAHALLISSSIAGALAIAFLTLRYVRGDWRWLTYVAAALFGVALVTATDAFFLSVDTFPQS